MFSKLFAVATVATLAAAIPTGSVSQCNTGSIQCCNDVKAASDPAVATLLGLLQAVVQDVTVQVGLQCSPLNVVGSSNTCGAQSVCCQNNSFNGVIAIGCTPINIGL